MKGYEELKKSVIDNCNEGEGCFNPNGCDHEFYRRVPAEGLNKKYTDTVTKCVSKCGHKYCDKFKWVIDRANHYGEKLDLNWEDVLDSWEENRSYWYMNYYQDANQPEIKGDKVRVFETVEDLHKSIGSKGFRCPSCGGISKNPYECNSELEVDGKACNWKVYGLFGHLGKGVFVYVKDKLSGEDLFMPISWEDETKEEIQKMTSTMLGETAYLLKHIESNTGIKVSKLRRDIKKGSLKAYKTGNSYYVIQSDLDRYTNAE